MYAKSHSTEERVKTIKELQTKWVLKQQEKEKQAPAKIDGVSTNFNTN